MKKIFTILVFLFVLSALSLGVNGKGVTQTNTFYAGQSSPAYNVDSLLYSCSDSSCNSKGSLVHDMNSGSSNTISFTYPYTGSTQSSPDYYAHFLFSECYLPIEGKGSIWGYGAHIEETNHFQKAKSCHSPIDSFSITNDNQPNEPVVVDVSTTLEADAHSAFSDNFLNWYPSGYEDYYSAETKITVEILHQGQVVHTASKTRNIMMDETVNVQFSWTPHSEGYFTARIKTDVVDCQCQSGEEEQSSKDFEVWTDKPYDECYTLIQDLEAVPEFPRVGDNVEISFNKLSNYADTNYQKTPVPTDVNYKITDSSSNVVDQGSFDIAANSNGHDYQSYSFHWEPQSSGNYNIRVTGVADSHLCTGKNPKDTANLGIIVDAPQTYDVTFDVYDDENYNKVSGAQVALGTLTGTTNSNGQVEFDMSPGTYSWDVSKTGFYPESGNVNVDNDETVEVYLTAVEDEYTVIFNVIDASTGLRVEDAFVEFGSRTGYTNENGRVIFDGVTKAQYDWRVSKDNYYATSGTVNIDEDETFDISLQAFQCTPGSQESRQCGQSDVGECCYGAQERTCRSDGIWGSWGECSGAVYPSDEVCDGKDNDCDGQADEGGVCGTCTPGETETQDCGPDTNEGVCQVGQRQRTCVENEQGGGDWGAWSDCSGAVYPSSEVCDGLDNDCDGSSDEGDVCAPTISGLPDQNLMENSGYNDNLFNLNDYVTNPLCEAGIDCNIQYSIVQESGPSVADCIIDSWDYMDCNVQGTGSSNVRVRAKNARGSDEDTFSVNVDSMATARLQIIHNAADPVLETVDVWVNDENFLPGFEFREATNFVDVPAETELEIEIAPSPSDCANQDCPGFDVTLEEGKSYIAFANGVLDGNFASNPDGRDTGVTLFTKTDALEESRNNNVDFFVLHGVTDAPGVDVTANDQKIVNNAKYGDMTDYINVAENEYELNVLPAGTDNVLACYDADLNGLGSQSAAVFASGFLNPSANEEGKGFALLAALADGTVVKFPECSKAPGISGIPDQYLEPASGLNDNIIDLWQYTTDADNDLSELDYSIVSQTNQEDVDCTVDSRYIDCEVKDDIGGVYSDVTVSVTDGENSDLDTFRVYVNEAEHDKEVTLIYPHGGEVLSGRVDVKWFASSSLYYPLLIDLEYSLDDGKTWTTIAEKLENDGVYEWNTKGYPDQAGYILRVVARNQEGKFVGSDVSDEFTIHNNKPDREEDDNREGQLYIETIQFINPELDVVTPGTEFSIRVTVENKGNYDLEDLDMSVLAHDFGSRASKGPIDLDVGDTVTRTFHLWVPGYVAKGDYPVRISISNNDLKRVKYRYVTVR